MPPQTNYERYSKAIGHPWTAYCKDRYKQEYNFVFKPAVDTIVESKKSLDDISELGMF